MGTTEEEPEKVLVSGMKGRFKKLEESNDANGLPSLRYRDR